MAHDPNEAFVQRVRAGARRLAKAAEQVTDSASFVRFMTRVQRWNNNRACMAGEILGEPEWSHNVEASLRKTAQAAMAAATAERQAERRWQSECLDVRIAAGTRQPVDEATSQYQAELRLMLGR